MKVAEMDPRGRLKEGHGAVAPRVAGNNMSRSFHSFKRSPALICSLSSFVVVYVVYGLLLVPNNSNLGARNGSRMRLAALAPPPSSVPTLAARYTDEELARVLVSQEARKAVEPRDLIDRLKEIGLDVGNRDAKQELSENFAQPLAVVESNGEITDLETLHPMEHGAAPAVELDGGKLVLKGPEIEDGIIPGKTIPPECNPEPHTDYDGVAVEWGLTFAKEDAADCCQACLDQARNAKEGQLRCNVWVYCPAEEGCYSPDIYEHKQFECWLKQSEKPTTNFKGRYSPDYRAAHPKCTQVVAWASGVISL